MRLACCLKTTWPASEAEIVSTSRYTSFELENPCEGVASAHLSYQLLLSLAQGTPHSQFGRLEHGKP
jgi:hypothetical protein